MKKAALLIFLLIVSCVFFSPNTAGAQKKLPPATTLKVKDTPLRAVLEKLSQLYKVDILYGDELVSNVTVSGDFSDMAIEDVLFRILRDTHLAFKRLGESQFYFHDKRKIQHFDISGRVLDSGTGETLPFANIRLAHLGTGTSTDQQGYFALRHVPARLCTLEVNYIGYASRTAVVDPTNLQPELEIELTHEPVQMKSVTVEALNREIFQVSEKPSQLAISARSFDDLPNLGEKDILRSIELMPGITGGTSGSSGITIRGSSSLDNLVLLDGMPIYNVNHSFGLLSAFSSDAIKDVRIYKGGYPARYGGRLSGVIDLTTKTGNFSEPSLSVGVGQINARASLGIPLAGKGAVFLAGRHSYNSTLSKNLHERLFVTKPYFPQFVYAAGFAVSPDGSEPPSANISQIKESLSADISFYDLIGKLTYLPSGQDILTFSTYLGSDDILSEVDFLDVYRSNEKNKSASEGVSAQWRHQWDTGLYSTLQFTGSDYSTRYKARDQTTAPEELGGQHALSVLAYYEYKNNLENFTGSWRHALQVHSNIDLAFGAELSKTKTIWQQSDNRVSEDFKAVAEATGLSLYFENDWQIGRRFETNLGLRTTYYDQTDKAYWLPRLSFTYDLSDGWSFKGAWGKYSQFLLNFADEFQFFGREIPWLLADGVDLAPGFSDHYVLGTHWQQNGWLFDVEVYQKNLRGLLELQNVVTLDDTALTIIPFFGQRKADARGVDILLQRNVRGFTGWLSYSYNRTRVKLNETSGFPEYPTTTDVPHQLEIVGSYAKRGWSFSTTWQVSSGRPYSIPKVEARSDSFGPSYYLLPPNKRNQARLPVSQRLDLSIARKFSLKHLSGEIGFSIYNLFNRDNLWYRHFDVERGELKAVDVKLLGFTPSLSVELQFN